MIIQSSRSAALESLAASRVPRRRSRVCRCYATAVHRSDPYAVLGLERSAQGEDIKARYYDLVKEYHPDRGGQNTPEAKETFTLIADAYALLRNPTKRAAYLQSGIGWEHESAAGGRSSRTEPAAATDHAGFHTGRRQAFDQRHAPAGSREDYERHKAAQEHMRKNRYRWDPDYVGSKPGMNAKDLDGIWTAYNARDADTSSKPAATFIAFIVLSLIIIINKPHKPYARNPETPHPGVEVYEKSPHGQMAKRIRESRNQSA